MRRPTLLTAAACVIVACSGSSSSTAVTADQACADAANAACARYETCSAAAITLTYGDISACKTRAARQCVLRLGAPQTGSTPDSVDGCVGKVPEITCPQLYTNDPPAECKPPAGPRANGAPCGDDPQCATAFCAIDTNNACGTCAPPPAAGASCAGGRCGPGLVCSISKTCVKPGDAGATCDVNAPCAFALSCFNGKCVASPGIGAPCDPLGLKNPTCDLSQALYCDAGSKTCKAATFGNAGDACGLISGAYKSCTGTLYCTATALGTGTCAAKIADGAPCTTDASAAPCLAPAVCTKGTCAIADPVTCG